MIPMNEKEGENRCPVSMAGRNAAPAILSASTFYLSDTSLWWEA